MRPATQSAISRTPGTVALGALAILFVFACVFWKERVFFGDAAWIGFRIANFGSLQIQEHRYGSFITQLVPLTGVWLGLPLKVLLALYSLSFNAFYLLAGILLYRWRQYDFLVLLALYFTITISVGFYWTNNEVHQGMTWLLLAFGWSTSKTSFRKALFYPVAFGLFFLAFSSHMLLLLAGGCLWVHLWLAGRRPLYGSQRGWILAGFALLTAGWRYYMSKVAGWYDAEKLSFIDGLTFSSIPEAFGRDSSRGFLERFVTHYPALPALLLLVLVALVSQKRWLALGWHLLSLAACWFFISITFSNFIPWYSESDWACWTMAALIPLALYGFPFSGTKITTGFLSVGLLLSLGRIYQSSTPFRKLLHQKETLVGRLQEKHLTKVAVVIASPETLDSQLLIAWPLPVEVYSLSAMSGPAPVVSLGFIQTPANGPQAADTLLIPFGTLSSRQFRNRYYPVDSVTPYAIYPVDSLHRWLN
ncbi:MAG: hypothetical protein EOP52_05035 [Sphingobacteriales bacterium]|nr:MAG: hypothetical protein EOP52_05035 [Sphingobacteriales bacterium]